MQEPEQEAAPEEAKDPAPEAAKEPAPEVAKDPAPEAAPSAKPRVPLALASVLAWLVIALVNAVFIFRLAHSPRSVRLAHHAVDAGHLLFLGAFSALVLLLWSRFGPQKPRWDRVVLAVLGVAIAFVTVWNDVAGFASEAAGERGGPVLSALMVTIVGLSPLVVAEAAAYFASRPQRWLRRGAFVALGLASLGMAIANDLLLPADYRGIHLFVALDAAVGLALAIARLPLPVPLASRPRIGWAALAAVLIPTALTVAVPPSNQLRIELGRVDGAVLVPVLARFGWGLERGNAKVPADLADWFEDRGRRRPIPPSSPSLLPKDPIVLLIGVDSMRADLFEKPETRKRLRHFVELERKSVDFEMVRSPGARTITTWSQVFTGRYVSSLRWDGGGNRLNIRKDPTLRVPELLEPHGVETASFVAYSALGAKGLSRGVDHVFSVPNRDKQSFGLSTDAVPLMLQHLDGPRKGPQFLFAHFMDPHFPYDAGKGGGGKKKPAFERFLSEVELADESFGLLMEGLAERGLLERSVVIVTADHGEAFGQHGTPYHTVNLYEELIRVPLFIHIPGVKPRKVTTPITLMDLGPTILDLMGVPTPATFLGQSLVPFLRGESPRLTRPIAAERSGTRAMVLGDRKVIVDREKGRCEVYDLTTDPREENNLADELGAEANDLAELVTVFFDTHAIPSGD